MGNDPTARAPDGTIKDVQTPPASATPDPKTPEAKEGDKAAADKAAVPEKYELKAPEGATIDQALVDKATPLFKELGLSTEGAQKLFDFHTQAVQAALDGPMAVMNAQRDEWRGAVVKDPALGDGIGDLKPAVKANIAAAIAGVGDAAAVSAFKEAMDLTGAGDNPALIKGLNAIGKLLSEGTLVRGGNPAPTGQTKSGEASRPSPAQAMYPNLSSSRS